MGTWSASRGRSAETAAGIQVQQGAEVLVFGTVQVYQGKKEVMISGPEAIRVLSPSAGQGRY